MSVGIGPRLEEAMIEVVRCERCSCPWNVKPYQPRACPRDVLVCERCRPELPRRLPDPEVWLATAPRWMETRCQEFVATHPDMDSITTLLRDVFRYLRDGEGWAFAALRGVEYAERRAFTTTDRVDAERWLGKSQRMQDEYLKEVERLRREGRAGKLAEAALALAIVRARGIEVPIDVELLRASA